MFLPKILFLTRMSLFFKNCQSMDVLHLGRNNYNQFMDQVSSCIVITCWFACLILTTFCANLTDQIVMSDCTNMCLIAGSAYQQQARASENSVTGGRRPNTPSRVPYSLATSGKDRAGMPGPGSVLLSETMHTKLFSCRWSWQKAWTEVFFVIVSILPACTFFSHNACFSVYVKVIWLDRSTSSSAAVPACQLGAAYICCSGQEAPEVSIGPKQWWHPPFS